MISSVRETSIAKQPVLPGLICTVIWCSDMSSFKHSSSPQLLLIGPNISGLKYLRRFVCRESHLPFLCAYDEIFLKIDSLKQYHTPSSPRFRSHPPPSRRHWSTFARHLQVSRPPKPPWREKSPKGKL